LTGIWSYSFLGKPLPIEVSAIKDTDDVVKGFVIASALIGCVIGGALSGFISKSWGRKNGLIIAAIAFFISALRAWNPKAFNILEHWMFIHLFYIASLEVLVLVLHLCSHRCTLLKLLLQIFKPFTFLS
jgi:MFS family permease